MRGLRKQMGGDAAIEGYEERMSDTDGKKPLGLGGSRSGQVKQSFSHGRTKNVVVETKRKRVVVAEAGRPGRGRPQARRRIWAIRRSGPPASRMPKWNAVWPPCATPRRARPGEALQRAADEVAREEERQRRRDEIEAKEREERERADAARAKAEEEERAKAAGRCACQPHRRGRRNPAAKAAPAEETAARTITPANAPGSAKPGLSPRKTDREREERERDARAKAKGDDDRRAGKLTLNEALAGEGGRTRCSPR